MENKVEAAISGLGSFRTEKMMTDTTPSWLLYGSDPFLPSLLSTLSLKHLYDTTV